MEHKKTFEPFERVIWRSKDYTNNVWKCALYSHYREHDDMHELADSMAISDNSHYILPFAGNETLVGTSDMPCEEVELKEGELIFLFDDIVSFEDFIIALRKFAGISGNTILSENKFNWKYCIPFSHFNPNDMEETKKNILCAKNGKIVKAKL